jgi:DNA (cytosine-5)-methyltransferase 1
MLSHLDLFSGIGGFSLAAKQLGGIRTTQFVEINPDAQLVLRHHFPQIPIHSDIRDYHPRRGQFDIVTWVSEKTCGTQKRRQLRTQIYSSFYDT